MTDSKLLPRESPQHPDPLIQGQDVFVLFKQIPLPINQSVRPTANYYHTRAMPGSNRYRAYHHEISRHLFKREISSFCITIYLPINHSLSVQFGQAVLLSSQ